MQAFLVAGAELSAEQRSIPDLQFGDAFGHHFQMIIIVEGDHAAQVLDGQFNWLPMVGVIYHILAVRGWTGAAAQAHSKICFRSGRLGLGSGNAHPMV